MIKAAQIFNPLYVTGNSDLDIVTCLYLLADRLIDVGDNCFTEDCTAQLKEEMHNFVEADRDHNLDIFSYYLEAIITFPFKEESSLTMSKYIS